MRGSYEPVPAFKCNPCLWMLVPKNATSVLRAMTLMVVYIMFHLGNKRNAERLHFSWQDLSSLSGGQLPGA